MARQRNNSKPDWKVNVTFIPFENDIKRDQAYRIWARLFLRAKRNEIMLKRKRSVPPGNSIKKITL